jgi:hypothetical protein
MNNNFFLLLCCTFFVIPCYGMDKSQQKLSYFVTKKITTNPSLTLREQGITKTRKNPVFPVFVVPKNWTEKHKPVHNMQSEKVVRELLAQLKNEELQLQKDLHKKEGKKPDFPAYVVQHPGSKLLKEIGTDVLRRQKEIEVLQKKVEEEESCNRSLLKELEEQKEHNDLKRLQNNYLAFRIVPELLPADHPIITARISNRYTTELNFPALSLTDAQIVQYVSKHGNRHDRVKHSKAGSVDSRYITKLTTFKNT